MAALSHRSASSYTPRLSERGGLPATCRPLRRPLESLRAANTLAPASQQLKSSRGKKKAKVKASASALPASSVATEACTSSALVAIAEASDALHLGDSKANLHLQDAALLRQLEALRNTDRLKAEALALSRSERLGAKECG